MEGGGLSCPNRTESWLMLWILKRTNDLLSLFRVSGARWNSSDCVRCRQWLEVFLVQGMFESPNVWRAQNGLNLQRIRRTDLVRITYSGLFDWILLESRCCSWIDSDAIGYAAILDWFCWIYSSSGAPHARVLVDETDALIPRLKYRVFITDALTETL